MKLSIIIPVYNERKFVKTLLRKVEAVKLPLKKEIILVDDCSKDGSQVILKRLKRHKVIFHKRNKGKGAAIRTGLRHATGDIVIIQDADLEYNPQEYPKLLKPILDGKTDVVYGSRLHTIKNDMIDLHYLGNVFLSALFSILYFRTISDMETCYKVFKRNILRTITLTGNRFEIEPEITAKLIRRGYTIYEVPINFNPRPFSEGKKISWIDGVKAVYYIIKFRFSKIGPK